MTNTTQAAKHTADHGLLDANLKEQVHRFHCYPELLSALDNLVERGLIKDTDGDHYQEVLDVIAKAKGAQ